jgi:hypothetical protein
MKKCSKCKIIKDESEFYHTSTSGCYGWCKSCHIADVLKRKKFGVLSRNTGAPQDTQQIEYGSCCTILKSHADILRDDPERLSTSFIRKMSGCDCEKI